jgi:signal transduction histidine kinase
MNVIEFPARRAEFEYDDDEGLLQAERLRIARELHDVIAYSFATIKVQAGVALRLVDDAPAPLAEALRAIDAASKEALGEFRGILGMLRNADGTGLTASVPGVDGLDGLVTGMTAAGVRTLLVVTGEIRSLPPAVSLAAFRLAQESLSNVLQHEGATSAVVTLTYEADGITIEIVNEDGDHADVLRPRGTGHGIAGMRERVAALGGDFEVGLRPDGGFRVFARLPLLPRSS